MNLPAILHEPVNRFSPNTSRKTTELTTSRFQPHGTLRCSEFFTLENWEIIVGVGFSLWMSDIFFNKNNEKQKQIASIFSEMSDILVFRLLVLVKHGQDCLS